MLQAPHRPLGVKLVIQQVIQLHAAKVRRHAA